MRVLQRLKNMFHRFSPTIYDSNTRNHKFQNNITLLKPLLHNNREDFTLGLNVTNGYGPEYICSESERLVVLMK